MYLPNAHRSMYLIHTIPSGRIQDWGWNSLCYEQVPQSLRLDIRVHTVPTYKVPNGVEVPCHTFAQNLSRTCSVYTSDMIKYDRGEVARPGNICALDEQTSPNHWYDNFPLVLSRAQMQRLHMRCLKQVTSPTLVNLRYLHPISEKPMVAPYPGSMTSSSTVLM